MRVETSSKYPSSQLFLLTARVTSAPPTGLMNFKVISSFSSKLCFLFCSVATLDTLMATLRRFSVLTASLLSSSSCASRLRFCTTASCSARSLAAVASFSSFGVDTSMWSPSRMPNAAAVLMGSSTRPPIVKVEEESVKPNLVQTECMRTCSRMPLRKLYARFSPYTGCTVMFKRLPYPSPSMLSMEPSCMSAADCTRAEMSRAEAAGANAASKATPIRRCILARRC
mmetsp:Transcript_47378/g.146539  ORF Transcript_47378/g.146539 Transcript_47378/m.146539 type:complete len:227 (+) Transcript_47378:104-784(+)